MTVLALDRARELLSYDPATGIFRWKMYRAPNAKVGDRAGAAHPGRYISIGLDQKIYKAHRLAWLLMTGIWPSGVVDHRNGDPLDNRWDNLRLANQSLNNANARRRADNTSGYKGVSFRPGLGKWRAYINRDRRRHYLGYFDTPEQAAEAYRKAAVHLFGEFARAG